MICRVELPIQKMRAGNKGEVKFPSEKEYSKFLNAKVG